MVAPRSNLVLGGSCPAVLVRLCRPCLVVLAVVVVVVDDEDEEESTPIRTRAIMTTRQSMVSIVVSSSFAKNRTVCAPKTLITDLSMWVECTKTPTRDVR